ncbi:MAG TPA: aspartate kinase [Kofleriaceae bacterium]|nr:aspartate kinase [Kofleriaceae bacterium]
MRSQSEEDPASPWWVLKFGGTSVSSRQAWEHIDDAIREHRSRGRRVLVVCSAVRGITNLLESALETVGAGGSAAAQLASLRATHVALGDELDLDAAALLSRELRSLDRLLAPGSTLTPARRARVLAHGELMSTRLGTAWLARRDQPVRRIDARALLRAQPVDETIGPVAEVDRYLSAQVDSRPNPRLRLPTPVVVTQGFLARGQGGGTVLLGRGGSDTSAACLAAVIGAEALEIWTDVPGMFSADPRTVDGARLIRAVSYAEAETMGALGAKVLHPRSVRPVRERGIPLWIRWTHRPKLGGTVVHAESIEGAKAITSRGGLGLLTMCRPSQWQPVGFMAEVAECFRRTGVSMDLISSSPSEIRATIDLAALPGADAAIGALLADLERVCAPTLMRDLACVSIIGDGVAHRLATQAAEVLALSSHDVHLVVHAANDTHVSWVVDAAHADEVVATAHDALFTQVSESYLGAAWSELVDVPNRITTRAASA